MDPRYSRRFAQRAGFRKTLMVAGLAAMTLLSACGDNTWLGGDDGKVALKGTRINALPADPGSQLTPDPADAAVALPAPQPNADWPQPGGMANHNMQHLVVGDVPKPYWVTEIGKGTGKRNRLMGEPVIAEGKVFAIDVTGRVTALKTFNGTVVWQTELAPDDVDGESVLGGGVTYADGKIFATTGFSEVSALDSTTGKVLWRRTVTAPVRAGATVYDGKVLFTSVDNKGWALSETDGKVLWTTSGNDSQATLLAAASPAADHGMVLMPFSSGEISAVRADDGTTLWSDVIAGVHRNEATATIADIAARPVMDGHRVFVVGYGGFLVGIDARTGNRAWQLEASSISQPWLAGDTLFVVTSDAKVLAVDAGTGKIRWSTKLPELAAENEMVSNGGWAGGFLYWLLSSGDNTHVRWTGPVLASNRLIITGSDGRAVTLSPYDGKFLGSFSMPYGVNVEPSVAGGLLYLLMDNGEIVAFK